MRKLTKKEKLLFFMPGSGGVPPVPQYSIDFIRANQSKITRSGAIYITGDYEVEFYASPNIDDNTQASMMGGTGGGRSLGNYTGRKLRMNTAAGIWDPVVFSASPTTWRLLIKRVGTEIKVYVNDVLKATNPSYTGNLEWSDIGRYATLYWSGQMHWFRINNEIFNFPEGTGNKTTGSLGTVLTLYNTNGTIESMWIPRPEGIPSPFE